MKKIFLIALAAIGMTACMQEEVMDTPTGGAITFENAFVDNATRADTEINNNNLDEFQVWGFVKAPSGVVFNKTLVSKKDGLWSYEGTQYWAPDNDYYFAAVAPVSALWELNTAEADVTGPGVLSFTNDAATDLVYAEKHVRSAAAGQANAAVALHFQHLLSKVKLTFTNNFGIANYKVVLSGIEMTTPESATIDLRDAHTWDYTGATTKILAFTSKELANNMTETTDEEYFVFPTACGIKFNLDVYVGNEKVYEGSKTATLPADAFEMGHAYNLSAEINADVLNFDEIVFTVDKVDEWDKAPNTYDAEANLIYAAQIGGTYKLTKDVVLDAPVVVPAGVDFVLDLNDKTITTSLEQEGRHHYAILNNGTMAIEGNGAINARGLKNFGTMVVNGNVTITNIDANGGAAIWNEGKVTINAGTYATKTDAGEGSYGAALNTRAGGEAVVNAGTFHAFSQLTYAIINEGTTTINNATVVGKHGAVAGAESNDCTTINGGSFSLMENPGVSDHCVYCVSTIKGGTFTLGNNTDSGAKVFCESNIAAGYKAVEDNGVYTVGLATVATTAALQAAINEGQSPIYLAANTTFEGTVVMKSNITIEGLEGSKMHCVNLNGAQNVNLYNITFDAAGAAMSYGGDNAERYYANIFSRDNSNSANVAGAKNLVIDGCHFTGTFPGEGGCVTSFADQTKTGSHNITIKNCIFDIENCGYAIYGYYTGDNAGNFVIENNTFKTATYANTIYLGRYMSSKPVVLKDNTFEKVSTFKKAFYLQDHGEGQENKYGVSVDASGNTFAN